MSETDIERMISGFEKGIEGRPDYARNLIGLAELAIAKKEKMRAVELARKVLAAAATGSNADGETVMRARALLSSQVRGYHAPMMNDDRRNKAWRSALERAIRPGMHVLEIGTGAGMLALMAARAGASRVTTCEKDALIASLAVEIARANGVGDAIDVIAKGSQELIPGTDSGKPADLLFCDIFGDSLLDFDPLPALSDARRRLLAPGAPVIPAAGEIRAALGNWHDFGRTCQASEAAGFKISLFSDFIAPSMRLAIGDPGLRILSGPQTAFRFDFSAASHPENGSIDLDLEASADAEVNGIVTWISLELDAETVLEAKPEPGAVFFSSPRFHPLDQVRTMQRGDVLRVTAAYRQTKLYVWTPGSPTTIHPSS